MKAPFIKIDWEDVSENFTPERIKRVKAYLQTKYNTKHVQVVTKTLTDKQNTRLKTLEVTDSILDPQYQKTLMRDFLTENGIQIKWELVDRLDSRVNSEIDKINQNKVRYNKWFIKKIEFSNFLSFGRDNVIDFTPLAGISVIESTPKNFGGKSTSSVDLLMFLFFNSTTKTKTNAEIFNKFTDDDDVVVKGYITIDGENYVIERSLVRKKGRSGDYTVKAELDFYKEKEDGTTENLTGEQRSLKQKEEICKEIYSDWSKKLVSNTNNIVDLEQENSNNEESIVNSTNEISRLEVALEGFKTSLASYEEKRDGLLSARNNDIDQELIKTNPVTLENDIKALITKQSESKSQSDAIVVSEPSQYYVETEHNELKAKINQLLMENRLGEREISEKEKHIKLLEEGKICPKCNRPLDEVDHTDEIEETKKEIGQYQRDIQTNLTEVDLLKEQSTAFENLKTEFDTYERNKLRKERFLLEVDQRQFEIDSKKLKLERFEQNKSKLDENQKIDNAIVVLKTQIDTANGDIRNTNISIERHRGNITSLKEKIEVNNKLIEKIKAEEELQGVFKIYLTVYGKNGISKTILKNMIPLINQELHRLLSDSCYFFLELNINDKNELEFLMIDSETRIVKPLNSGSGYERTISSLALRSVLTKVSSLPKPNIVVMDEVFGKIADENLEMVGEFFKKIKNYFEHIFVISHNPLIRNWSDNIIMIKKEDNVSSIDYITSRMNY